MFYGANLAIIIELAKKIRVKFFAKIFDIIYICRRKHKPLNNDYYGNKSIQRTYGLSLQRTDDK